MSTNDLSPQSQPVPVVMYAPVATVKPANGLGTSGMILGIVAVSTFWIPVVGYVAPVCAILAIIFGAIGISRAKRGAASNRGQAKAGLVCGITYWIIMAVMLAVVVYATMNYTPTY